MEPDGVPLTNPVGIRAAGPLLDVLIPVLSVVLVTFGVLVVAHVVWRFRRTSGTERQQLRWFTAAATLFPVLMGLSMVVDGADRRVLANVLVTAAFFLSFNGMALAIGVAVTRYRLYAIDRIVRRTVTYALLTAALGGVYATGMVGVARLLPTDAAEAAGDLLVAGSTLAVAALFSPVRRRVQTAVDRRFDRARYDATRTIEEFGHRLRDEIDVDTLRAALVSTAAVTTHPAHVSTWLSPRQHSDRP
jgi:hypothetical protein